VRANVSSCSVRFSRLAAFTLMELLLAVAVFAIVLAALNTVYFAALRLRNRTQASFDAALPVEQAVAIMKRDLAGLRPPGSGPLAGQFQTTSTTNDNTSMDSIGTRLCPDLHTGSGFIDEWTPFSEVQRVAYFLAMPTNQSAGRDLIRAVSRNLLPVTTDEVDRQFLLEGVQSALFQYYDGSVWQDVWDSTTSSNLPFAVRVQITMVPPDDVPNAQALNRAPIEIVVPIKTDVLTNQVAATGGTAP
jgi:type II secretion system protein J